MSIFTFYRTPSLVFGENSLYEVSVILSKQHWGRIAVFTGESSFRDSEHWKTLRDLLDRNDIGRIDFKIKGEPTVDIIDRHTETCRFEGIDAILAIGGGSVIDCGKAVSAMLASSGGITEYLEGVGSKKPTGEKIPVLAVPTTSGTGAEATKNAVISNNGPHGFKKSLRHDNYVPDFAVIDPRLTITCPPAVTASSGLDAITQLMEAYVSTKASPLTDSIAIGGLMAAGRSFETSVTDGGNIQARTDMAYAAFTSGITLANAGLGLVHGIAGPMGAHTGVPHGVVCGTLIAEATGLIIERLRLEGDQQNRALEKYAEIKKYLDSSNAGSVAENCDALVSLLDRWTDRFNIPRLGRFDIDEQVIEKIADQAGTKNSPVRVSKEDIITLIKKRL